METSKTMYSKVLALIKESSKNSISRFENLRDKNACFPEYGGIGKTKTNSKFSLKNNENFNIENHQFDNRLLMPRLNSHYVRALLIISES